MAAKEKLKNIKGIITYITQRGMYTILRLGMKTWLYVKNNLNLPHSCIGQEITAKALRQIKKDKPVYTTDTVHFKKDLFRTTPSYEESIVKMLKATGRHALLKKLLNNPNRMRKYANNPAKLYFEDLIDVYTLIGILRMRGVFAPDDYLMDVWIKHIAEEVYKNSTNVFAKRPEDSVPLRSLVRLLSQKLKEHGSTTWQDEQKILNRIFLNPYVIIEDNTVYPAKVWNFKQTVLRKLENLNVKPGTYQSLKDALKTERVITVTGKAGTGKTTLVVNELKDYQGLVVYTATTGKASKRLPNGITLHRWLGFDGKRFTDYDAYADVLVIDEASMLTWQVLNEVFLRDWKNLIFIGDPEQLPPVGEGYAFRVILPLVPQIKLTEVKRGVMEVQTIKRTTIQDTIRTLKSLVASFERQKQDYAVLAPYYRGPLGVDNLNGELKKIAPVERVIVTKNYYNGGLIASNGDTGILLKTENGTGLIQLKTGEIVRIPSGYYTHGYCFSVHKAQGSEWDYVVFIKTSNLSDELITSATTRGKQKVYVLEVTK